MGKIREKSGNFTKTCQGNIREFSDILIVSPFSRIYIYNRVGNSSLLGHCPFGLDVNLIFKGTEASWEGTKATFHPSPGAPRPV